MNEHQRSLAASNDAQYRAWEAAQPKAPVVYPPMTTEEIAAVEARDAAMRRTTARILAIADPIERMLQNFNYRQPTAQSGWDSQAVARWFAERTAGLEPNATIRLRERVPVPASRVRRAISRQKFVEVVVERDDTPAWKLRHGSVFGHKNRETPHADAYILNDGRAVFRRADHECHRLTDLCDQGIRELARLALEHGVLPRLDGP